MLSLFQPQSKVQKDRQIIRETDMRMAKYSRRGLISNFLVYILCLAFEQTFIESQQTLTIILSGGLLLSTLLRGYFLFRFDSIYPRAPAAWRNKYFIATLIGASWWGLILAFITFYMDMRGEATLMWLYTVVFFSTTAHAFAPYKKFLSLYQLIGIVPAACCTFFVGDYLGALYGFILLFFYIILNHHCALMSLDYWDRLEAQYTLAKKSVYLEEEKRDSKASVQLAKEYIGTLQKSLDGIIKIRKDLSEEMRKSDIPGRRELESVSSNLEMFNSILDKTFVVESRAFNVRQYIQAILSGYVRAAEEKGMELESSISPTVPSRLKGDAGQIGYIIKVAVETALESWEKCGVFVEVEYLREQEYSGFVVITLSRLVNTDKKHFKKNQDSATIVLDTKLVLAKGIAEVLKGSVEIEDGLNLNSSELCLRIPMEVVETSARTVFHRMNFKGRPLLLIDENALRLNRKQLELGIMGFNVQTASSFKEGYQILNDAQSEGSVIESVVYYNSHSQETSLAFSRDLLDHGTLKYVQQFVLCSDHGAETFKSSINRSNISVLHFVNRPSGFFEFERVFSQVFHSVKLNYSSDDHGLSEDTGPALKMLWYRVDDKLDRTQFISDVEFNIQEISEIKHLKKAKDNGVYDIIIIDDHQDETEQVIRTIREIEQDHKSSSYVPIVVLGPDGSVLPMFEAGADCFVPLNQLKSGDQGLLTSICQQVIAFG